MTIVQITPLLTEELFQHIWQYRLFNQAGLTSLEGEPVQIIFPGRRNTNAGPDFIAARIRIGKTQWAGNVELHLRTSDWYRHRHQHNPQYGNMILHVVFEHDVTAPVPSDVPCLELQQYIPKLLLRRYAYLRQSEAFVPCGMNAAKTPPLVLMAWKDRLMAERLERKAGIMQGWLRQNKYNWEEVCYWAIVRSFGGPVNSEMFLQLARSLPYQLVLRHRHNLLQLEALLFGQAGMLEGSFEEEYPQHLQKEYAFLRHKYRLQPMQGRLWKWLRMRPSSFPTIRIASLAHLLYRHAHFFSQIMETTELPALEKWLDMPPSPYWEYHYRFDTPVVQTRRPAKAAIHNILINTVLPLLYLYGKERGAAHYQERALNMMARLPAEENSVIKGWKETGMEAECAADSQALLELRQSYCEQKKCLDCAIGVRLLRQGLA